MDNHNEEIKSESRLTFMEATSIIVGHGVGAGILAVPYLASRAPWWDFLWILAVAYAVNLLLHLMIAELSLNNNGAQFVKCFENELFTGRFKKVATWIVFGFLAFSVLCNVASFITGSAAVFASWFSLPAWLGMCIYYIIAGLVVFFGMKIVGICEKYSVIAMVIVIGILFVATVTSQTSALPSRFIAATNSMALYSTVAFSLSAVMSVPQVVKGVAGDRKKVIGAIAAGFSYNCCYLYDAFGCRTGNHKKRSSCRLECLSWRLGKHSRLCVLVFGSFHLILGKHAQHARHNFGTDKMELKAVLAFGNASVSYSGTMRNDEFCRFCPPCRNNSGTYRNRNYNRVQPFTKKSGTKYNLRKIWNAAVSDYSNPQFNNGNRWISNCRKVEYYGRF